jgi:hypothetical protein
MIFISTHFMKYGPEMKREVPCPDYQGHTVGLRMKVGLVQEGERALPHRHVLRPGVDVPVSCLDFLCLLMANQSARIFWRQYRPIRVFCTLQRKYH